MVLVFKRKNRAVIDDSVSHGVPETIGRQQHSATVPAGAGYIRTGANNIREIFYNHSSDSIVAVVRTGSNYLASVTDCLFFS